jgi:predicted RNA-binding protein YlxR (DUF448 family)
LNKAKKIPMRTCLGCGAILPKKELLRIVRTPDGTVLVDRTGKQAGRGAYICNKKECLEKAVKAKRLGRSLEVEVGQDVIDQLRVSMEVQVGLK